jgi:chromosomal replication initiation ATPase DnaA
MKQLPLDLVYHEGLSEEDFFASKCNETAIKFVLNWREWPNQSLIIWGPRACGKTHLSHIWQSHVGGKLLSNLSFSSASPSQIVENAQALVIDDAHMIQNQTDFFHTLNLCREKKIPLLITMECSPQALNMELPDLLSRLKGIVAIEISSPQEETLRLLLIKQCMDQHLPLFEDMIPYIIHRIERSYSAIKRFVYHLRHLCLRQQKDPTLPLIKEALDCVRAELEET